MSEPPRPDRYDDIGTTYLATRSSEPKYAERIIEALGDAETVLNVGAGTGSYEPSDRRVVAVEPSVTMVAQRPLGAAPCIRAAAEHLPFDDDVFDAAMGVLTVHHWSDPSLGLSELRRVARDTVAVVCTDVQAFTRTWLARDYFADALDLGGEIDARQIAELLSGSVEPLVAPHDCADGFMLAYWRRPEAYLDPVVRAGISWFATVGEQRTQAFVDALAADLASGAWHERNGAVLELQNYDCAHRLVVARG